MRKTISYSSLPCSFLHNLARAYFCSARHNTSYTSKESRAHRQNRVILPSRCFGNLLVLQLELGFCSSQSPFVMIRLSNGLVLTPKERPGKGLGVCGRLLPNQRPGQA